MVSKIPKLEKEDVQSDFLDWLASSSISMRTSRFHNARLCDLACGAAPYPVRSISEVEHSACMILLPFQMVSTIFINTFLCFYRESRLHS